MQNNTIMEKVKLTQEQLDNLKQPKSGRRQLYKFQELEVGEAIVYTKFNGRTKLHFRNTLDTACRRHRSRQKSLGVNVLYRVYIENDKVICARIE